MENFTFKDITPLTKTFTEGQLALKSEFVSNDPIFGKKVLTSIEDGLKTCSCFYISVAFITLSGITPLLPILEELEKKEIKGKILTTDYLTFSEPKALLKLSKFKNITLKMYVTNQAHGRDNVGFHTKGYIFKDNSENYQIIIGSSNLTQSALTVNKEWNTKLYSIDNEELAYDVLNEFNNLWSSHNSYIYEDYRNLYEKSYKLVKAQQKAALSGQVLALDTYKLAPNRMQTEFIDNLKTLMQNGAKKALLISATGTGKTYASAFAVRELNAQKLLFIVHRETIAKQALKSYGVVFNEEKKSALLSANNKNIEGAEFIFSTMQTICKDENLNLFKKDEFDVIVIDEAHHAGAFSYQKILNYFEPKKLFLGMTASPERGDNIDVFKIFDHNIAYEIRLQQALEHDFLCPFHYFGITDIINNEDKLDLPDFNLLCSEDRVKFIMDKLEYYDYSGDKPHGLIFCSRSDIAEKLSQAFNESKKYKTIFLGANNSQKERDDAIRRLEAPADTEDYLDYIFSVDIFNEGVDIPKVNQVVMLRPTQSPIVFVQQLGRGLRKYEDKEYVVILDFIGNYTNNYMIPMALSGDRSYDKENLRRYVQEGNRIIPGSSTINFDEISKSRIFDSIDTTNFSAIKLIRENYQALKAKIGRIPKIIDFEKYGAMDVQCIFKSSLGSYYNFLNKYESEFNGMLTCLEAKHIEFVSRQFGNGKREHELLILKLMLDGAKDLLIKRLEALKHRNFSSQEKENLKNIMSNQFITGTAASNLSDIQIAYVKDDDLFVTDSFLKMLGKDQFKDFLLELVDYALDFYRQNYKTKDDNYFALYKLYSYADVCRILNWSKLIVAQNIGGYRYDKDTNTLPVFVNYNKDENINESIKYEDFFVNKEIFSWVSKSNRKLSSNELIPILSQAKSKTKIELFVRKNNSSVKISEGSNGKNKDTFKEFYYLGPVDYVENSAEQISMENNDKKPLPAVKLLFKLKSPVRDDIYDYIVNK